MRKSVSKRVDSELATERVCLRFASCDCKASTKRKLDMFEAWSGKLVGPWSTANSWKSQFWRLCGFYLKSVEQNALCHTFHNDSYIYMQNIWIWVMKKIAINPFFRLQMWSGKADSLLSGFNISMAFFCRLSFSFCTASVFVYALNFPGNYTTGILLFPHFAISPRKNGSPCRPAPSQNWFLCRWRWLNRNYGHQIPV